ncbi:MAG: FHA domain-containing protein [Deltaproteobacteria bacterium]
MSVCASCGRNLPCGCPAPRRGESALSALFGVVCPTCDGYNEPARERCVLCSASLSAAPAATPLAPALEPTHASKAPVAPQTSAPAAAAPVARDRSAARTLLVPVEEMLGERPAAAAAPLLLVTPPGPAPVLLTEAAASTRVCGHCGTENGLDYRFCGTCGAPLAAAPAPAPAAEAQKPLDTTRLALRVLRGERRGQNVPGGLRAGIGRGGCEIVFPGDPYVAPLHCTLSVQGGRLLLRDEGAPSGTFVRIREEEPLASGDYFSIGDHLLRFLGPQPPAQSAGDGTRLFGGPRPPADAVKIEEIHEGLLPGRASVRLGPTVLFGREEGCHVAFPGDRFVSSRHCQLTVGLGGRARLKDLGSTNGTFRKLPAGSERELGRGDCLRVGGQVIQVVEV